MDSESDSEEMYVETESDDYDEDNGCSLHERIMAGLEEEEVEDDPAMHNVGFRQLLRRQDSDDEAVDTFEVWVVKDSDAALDDGIGLFQ